MAEHFVPSRFYERMATEPEAQKRKTFDEMVAWIQTNLSGGKLHPGDSVWLPDYETGEPIETIATPKAN